MASIVRCQTRAELADRMARRLSREAAQVGVALRMFAHCHIDRSVFAEQLSALRSVLAEAENLADEIDCSERIAAEAA